MADQREVADQVQHLVAHELIGEAQRPVLDALAGEHDGIVFRSAANQPHVLQRLRLVQKSEGARRGDVACIVAAR